MQFLFSKERLRQRYPCLFAFIIVIIIWFTYSLNSTMSTHWFSNERRKKNVCRVVTRQRIQISIEKWVARTRMRKTKKTQVTNTKQRKQRRQRIVTFYNNIWHQGKKNEKSLNRSGPIVVFIYYNTKSICSRLCTDVSLTSYRTKRKENKTSWNKIWKHARYTMIFKNDTFREMWLATSDNTAWRADLHCPECLPV